MRPAAAAPETKQYSLLAAPPTSMRYTLSLHDALPISEKCRRRGGKKCRVCTRARRSHCSTPHRTRGKDDGDGASRRERSEEHTSELQSQSNLVCRLLLEKKKEKKKLGSQVLETTDETE